MNLNRPAVVMSPDKGYRIASIVTIYSLLKNHPGKSFQFYLLLEEAEPDWIQTHVKMIQEMGSLVKLVQVDVKAVLGLNSKFSYPVSAYFRIFTADRIPESRALYLDSDILIHGSLDQLFSVDLKGNLVAAVEDYFVRDLERLGLQNHEGYFNSGVLLMDLDGFRSHNIGSEVLSFIQDNAEKISFADQCGFNAVLKGLWLPLAPKWNIQSGFFDKPFESVLTYSKKSIINALEEPVIIHYTGTSKPWKTDGKHPFRALFWQYLKETPLARRYPEDFTLANIIRRLMPIFIRKWYWRNF